jgi:hypothetical protein
MEIKKDFTGSAKESHPPTPPNTNQFKLLGRGSNLISSMNTLFYKISKNFEIW